MGTQIKLTKEEIEADIHQFKNRIEDCRGRLSKLPVSGRIPEKGQKMNIDRQTMENLAFKQALTWAPPVKGPIPERRPMRAKTVSMALPFVSY